ncbi:MAG TPA: cellulose binding domain-containing protein [Actinocrinis sp.]|uniref:cellulose binding domain-containing protein n=1 Tax=Actinocrinis sp. TaxID=1920516 RepID=UPI002DDCB723|nr:cellulose binding domain-containing protein [Actinocrinis sp.]HEV2344854.1 cellulose binding domain-containing protein [Actinocrinis sp.]
MQRRPLIKRWMLAAALPAAAVLGAPAAQAGAATGAVIASHAAAAVSSNAVTAATVSVNVSQSLATVPATAIGGNGSVYDAQLTDAAVPGLLKNAGIGLIRFPGGTESDEYNWKNNTDVLSGKAQAVNFDQYATLLSQTGAQGMVTVDYGTGDTIGASQSPVETGAQVAADWVRYANVTHNYGVKYWEIGNEVYGNGTYGANWEPDKHCSTSTNPTDCGPAVYAQNVKTYISAMKAVDPSIVIGVVLTAPGNWPDAVTNSASPQTWNQTVLSALGNQIGFADVHWYPQNPSSVTPPGPTDSGLLGDTSQIPTMVSSLKSLLSQYSGGAGVPIMVTETNSVSSNPGKQTLSIVNALYLNQDYLGWLQSGVSSVDWWQIHNGIVTGGDNGSSLYGTATYGDYGILSDGSCGTINGAQVCEPAADTPFPAYYGTQLLSTFIHPGDTLVSASSSQSLLHSYAVKAADGSLRVLLVNDDPSNSYTAALSYSGFTPGTGTPTVATLAPPGTSISTAAVGSASSQTIAPYSAAVVTLQPGTSVTPPTTPGTPTASGITSSSVNLGWTASTSSTGIAGYDVVSVNGTTETVVASPTTNSATISGLTPSTSYTFAVYAKDTAGNRSARSGTVAVTTSAAGSSGGCTVTYTPNSWTGGFTANVTIANNGTSGWTSWTVKWSFPGDQKITSAWNAQVTQSGSAVTAVNMGYNGSVPVGGSTTFGFQGTWSSSNASPTAFTVNGAACG